MNDTADLYLANVQKGRIELSILIGFHDIWFSVGVKKCLVWL